MKPKHASVSALLVAVLTLLAAVLGVPATSRSAETEQLKVSPYKDSDFGSEVSVNTQHPVYATDIPSIAYVIESPSAFTYGDYYSVEILQDGKWYVLPFIDGMSWNDISYFSTEGGKGTKVILLNTLDWVWRDGEYRIIEVVNNKPYAAYFKMGDSAISAATPYGLPRLDTLPASYSADDARKDGLLVTIGGKSYNTETVRVFVEKVLQREPCMLRTVRVTEDGDPIITDITYDSMGNHAAPMRFFVRRDTTRDRNGKQRIQQCYYSFMSVISSGGADRICLSNYLMYKGYAPKGSAFVYLEPGKNEADLVELVLNSVLEPRFIMTLIAPDGATCIDFGKERNWDGDLYFLCRKAGSLWSVRFVDDAKQLTEISQIRWLNKDQAEIICKTTSGAERRFTYDFRDAQYEISVN